MVLTPYKPNQGTYARSAAGAALLVLSLFSSWRLTQTIGVEATFLVMGMKVPYSALWGAGLFVALAAVISVFTFGFQTGWAAVDGASRSFVDLMVESQAELQKVSWPSREELRRYTIVVLVCILTLGVFLYVADMVVSFVLTQLKVLPA